MAEAPEGVLWPPETAPPETTTPEPMPPDADTIQTRKAEHLHLAANGDVNTRTGAGWTDIHLVHEAIPAADLDAIDLGVEFLGRRLRAPLCIAGMTGGYAQAATVNACLARAAERHSLVIGIGSQRAAARRGDLSYTYAVAREQAPTAFLVGNIGAPQLIAQDESPPLTPADVRQLLSAIRADALAVHLNYLQETVQPEGDRRASGVLDALATLVSEVGVPVIGKETGAGVSRRSAGLLASAGVAAIDVGGVGGTTFAAVEGLRAEQQGHVRGRQLGETFREWGMPTAVSIVAARPTGLPIIATGGIRTGLDAAKALALGARLVGVARPLLQAALEGGDAAVDAWIEQFLAELRAAVFLTGLRTVVELRAAPRVIAGSTQEWLSQLGYLPEALARTDASA
ncbi:MAG TPA: type 2 isopentenyl-diphosphate Delta-isomerase [Chloroflexota bacterium]|nr:type 2 isopentenyl-diphosphate Delta-isomerase [Chloroflexota bacterium]